MDPVESYKALKARQSSLTTQVSQLEAKSAIYQQELDSALAEAQSLFGVNDIQGLQAVISTLSAEYIASLQEATQLLDDIESKIPS